MGSPAHGVRNGSPLRNRRTPRLSELQTRWELRSLSRDGGTAKASALRRVSKAGEPYFVLRAANSEMYSSGSARDDGMAAVRAAVPSATVDDTTRG